MKDLSIDILVITRIMVTRSLSEMTLREEEAYRLNGSVMENRMGEPLG